jgi:hypothetical protein
MAYSFNPLDSRMQLTGQRSVVTTGETFKLYVGPPGCGSYTLVVTFQPHPPPTITSQPQSQSVYIGLNASFSVAAQNALSYQWRKDGVAITVRQTRPCH